MLDSVAAVVVLFEASQPAFRAHLTATPKRVKAVGSHSDVRSYFFDAVPVGVVAVTTQFVTSQGGQVATSIDEKFCFGDAVDLDIRFRMVVCAPCLINVPTRRSILAVLARLLPFAFTGDHGQFQSSTFVPDTANTTLYR